MSMSAMNFISLNIMRVWISWKSCKCVSEWRVGVDYFNSNHMCGFDAKMNGISLDVTCVSELCVGVEYDNSTHV